MFEKKSHNQIPKPLSPQGILPQKSIWPVVCGLVLITGMACSPVIAVDDECNVDRDCLSRGQNLQCVKHLCVTIDNPTQGSTGPSSQTDTGTSTSPGTGSDTNTKMDAGMDASTTIKTDTSSSSDTYDTTDRDTNVGVNPTDQDTDTVVTTGAHTEEDTATDSITAENTEIATDTTPPSIYFNYTFTDDLEGFLGTGFTHDAANGYAEVETPFTGTNQTLSFRTPINISDWSNVIDVNAVVKVDQFVSGGLQLYITSGEDWTWCAQWFDFSHLTDWTTISMDVSSQCATNPNGDLSFVRVMGIEIHSGSTYNGDQNVHLLVDEMYVRHIAPAIETEVEGSDTAVASDTVVIGSDTSVDTTIDASVDASGIK